MVRMYMSSMEESMEKQTTLQVLLKISHVYLFAKVAAALCLLSMVFLITVEVIGRKFFNFSTLIADEYSGYLLVAVFSFGIADTYFGGNHICIKLVTSRLNFFVKKILDFITNILAFIFCTLLTWQCTTLLITSYSMKTISLTVARTPIYLAQIPLVIGSFLFTLLSLLRVFSSAKELFKTQNEV